MVSEYQRSGEIRYVDGILRANARLVYLIAKRFRRHIGSDLPLEDLVSAGNIGLLEAIRRYDPSHETRFATYASFWVGQAIRREIQRTGNRVRLPSYVISRILHLAAIEELGLQFTSYTSGRTGHASQLAENEVRRYEQLRQWFTVTWTSLDYSGPSAEGESCLQLASAGVRVVSGGYDCDDPAECAARHDLRSRISGAVGTLSVRRRQVIVERFGLDGLGRRSLQVIADELGLTKERVRQIQNQAIKQLRAEAHSFFDQEDLST